MPSAARMSARACTINGTAARQTAQSVQTTPKLRLHPAEASLVVVLLLGLLPVAARLLQRLQLALHGGQSGTISTSSPKRNDTLMMMLHMVALTCQPG
jgi:hypothetical protein